MRWISDSFFDNIYNLRLLRNFPATSRRRSCSRYRKIFPAWKNVKYQYGQGEKCSSTNTGVFHSQACTFPEESFILSSPCNSVWSEQGVTKRCLSWLTNSALVYESKCGEMGGSCKVSAIEYSCAHGAQINFEDLTPYLTCGSENWMIYREPRLS